MKKKIALMMVLAILFTSGIGSAQNEMPLNPPPGYYGSLTVNGQPAPPGTTIVAKIGGEVRGSILTSVSGLYGDDPGPSKLWVTGYNNELTPAPATVTFFLNDIAAQQTGTLIGAGTINSVDLTFIIPTEAGSRGTSGGGGGVYSAEPFDNIDFFEIRDAALITGMPVTFRFTNPQLAVYEVVITANTSAGLTSTKIEQLKGTSRLATLPPTGIIYKNMNIWLGSSGFAVSRNIREGIIRFRIENSWLSNENIDAAKITMMKWDGSQWISLETNQVRTDSTFAYYEASTNSYSPFAIRGVKAVSTATAGITPSVTLGASPTATSSTVSPPMAFNWILVAVVAVIIIAGLYYFAAKKEKK